MPLIAANLAAGMMASPVRAAQPTVENPYEHVDWESADYVHSMSHQHGWGRSTLEKMWAMGFRHFAFANYYPSRPREFPLPDDFLKQHPDALAAPNAEHHSCTDSRLHFNGLGSCYTTGGRQQAKELDRAVSPVEHDFTGLHGFDPGHLRHHLVRNHHVESRWVTIEHLQGLGALARNDRAEPQG